VSRSWSLTAHLVGLAALASACASREAPVRPQWSIALRTDAPIPNVADRLLVEITSDDGSLACPACRRIIDVSKSIWPVSFGVAETDRPLGVRARLYMARDVDADGQPGPLSIDTRVLLPRTPGAVDVALPMRCIGVGSTSATTCDAATGAPGAIPTARAATDDPDMVPGSFARVPPCGTAPVLPGKVCVNGGLFLFRESVASFSEDDRRQVRLVRVSSFYVDRTEVTVGQVRALLASGATPVEPSGDPRDSAENALCTYHGRNIDTFDELPVNCVTRAAATAYCAARGERLVRDAEFAYVAGNGGVGTLYPWGSDEEVCARAVVGRGFIGTERFKNYGSPECRLAPRRLPSGLVSATAATSDGDDVLGVGALAGNVSEWVADDYARMSQPCWNGTTGYLNDPVCRTANHQPMTRGGSWFDPTLTAMSTFRSAQEDQGRNTIGFRCARDL
jgi:formylglycine-generating enzyme required for sulfatase activity